MRHKNLVVALLLLVVYTGCAIGEVPPPINLQNTTGNFWANHTWDPTPAADVMSLVSGDEDGTFTGFNWTGSTWQSSPGIASGLGDVGWYSKPEVFQKDGTWYLIAGAGYDTFTGFNWTGSTWQSSPDIVSDLGGVGDRPTPAVFQKDGTWYLIAGQNYGAFTGFNWTGSTWQSSPGIASGLGDVGWYSKPEVFQKDGTWYLISGESAGGFIGFNWTGSTWQNCPGIVSGLVGGDWHSAPEVFQKDGTWYLISGDYYGAFTGFNWTGSTWQNDSTIASGLVDVDHASTPSVFEQVICATDSYNVSVNDVWHNTSPAYYNDTYTAHAWQNITVYAYNISDGGALSTGNISQNTQIPNNPITITNTSDWEGFLGFNVYVDYDATDIDSDTPTFSCNRTDLFSDFNTVTGTGNWVFEPGTYPIDFGVSDGYGSTSNYTMTIANATSPPSSSNHIAITEIGDRDVVGDGVMYVYIDDPELLPCTVSIVARTPIFDVSYITPPTKTVDLPATACTSTAVIDKYYADGTSESYTLTTTMDTLNYCAAYPYNGGAITTSMTFTNISDYFIAYAYMYDTDPECYYCDPTVHNAHARLYFTTEGAPRQVNNTVHILDAHGNQVTDVQIAIYDETSADYTQKWQTSGDGVIQLGHDFESDHDVSISARTFDGVYTLNTVNPGIRTTGDFYTIWNIPLNYNIALHTIDTNGRILFNVFAGVAEYTIIDPGAFWGMDLSDQGYVPVTNCSGFAMCDIIAEKDGYADYRVEALNWTSKSALVKDYRHNVVMEEE